MPYHTLTSFGKFSKILQLGIQLLLDTNGFYTSFDIRRTFFKAISDRFVMEAVNILALVKET